MKLNVFPILMLILVGIIWWVTDAEKALAFCIGMLIGYVLFNS